jgi:oligopeptide/dipeptide ABC transporter ATP-binding protein
LSNNCLLSLEDVKTHFFLSEATLKAVDGVNLRIDKGEVLGIVGESGCGKSTLALTIMRLVPSPGRTIDGKIVFDGKNLLELNDNEMQDIRGGKISMIFQDPTSSLNPLFTVGDQLSEAILLHQNVSKIKAKDMAVEILERVAIPDAQDRLRYYPHQLSGGMKQRIMLAMALSCNPKIVIADEPTTNLDVTVQLQILEMMKKMQKDLQTTIILITHDLGVVSEMSDNIAVMYCGKVVEYSDTLTILTNPVHPYTQALLGSFPTLEKRVDRLTVIRGNVPDLANPPSGCRFHPRCDCAIEECKKNEPSLKEIKKGHSIACHIDTTLR